LGAPAWQVPDWQTSPMVQALPSLQVVPFGCNPGRHCPVAGWQVDVWHWSLGVHTTGFPPVQMPFWQVSVWVHALPSMQVVPLLAAGLLQMPVAGSQLPTTWH
jgi:hypothetical protein